MPAVTIRLSRMGIDAIRLLATTAEEERESFRLYRTIRPQLEAIEARILADEARHRARGQREAVKGGVR